MRNVTHALLAAAALVASAACTVDHTVAPSVSGPSEQALSLRLTASPDTVPQDGATQSRIQVQAFDQAGKPIPNLTIRMTLNGSGALSAASVVTGSDGKAVNVFTAPMPSGSLTNLTSVLATPVGTDAAGSLTFQVNIALTPVSGPGQPQAPPSAPPVARFTVSPAAPGLNQSVFFNATQSTAAAGHQITAYNWDFGDGTTGSGVTPSHAYFRTGTYTVTLIVSDDAGQQSFPVAQSVTVSSTSSQIVADFTFSPSDPFVGQTVFFDSIQSTSSSTIVSWVWDFGDGVTCGTGGNACVGTTTKPQHPFASKNIYVVRLTVTDAAGGTAFVTKNVATK